MGQTPSRRSAIFVRSTGGVSKLAAQGPPPFASVPWQIAQLSAKTAFPASRDTSGVVDGAHPNKRRPNEIKLYFMKYPIIAELLLWRGTSSLLRFSRYTKTNPFWRLLAGVGSISGSLRLLHFVRRRSTSGWPSKRYFSKRHLTGVGIDANTRKYGEKATNRKPHSSPVRFRQIGLSIS